MGIISEIFGAFYKKSTYNACISIYNKAKSKRPDKLERDYLKIVLLTKPPFDYQYDQVIEGILDMYSDIHALANHIASFAKKPHLWESRKRNMKDRMEYFNNRNNEFFSYFWN
jgi:hypothetical protein